jgi:hypothetical protein
MGCGCNKNNTKSSTKQDYTIKDVVKDHFADVVNGIKGSITGKSVPKNVEYVDNETQQKRLNVCNKCDYLGSYVGVKKCNACGCVLGNVGELGKTRYKKSSCPKYRW